MPENKPGRIAVIQEGTEKKGGIHNPPSTPRPSTTIQAFGPITPTDTQTAGPITPTDSGNSGNSGSQSKPAR